MPDTQIVDDYGLAVQDVVTISESGKDVVIEYCPRGSFQARRFIVPRSAFLRACTQFADNLK